MKNITFLLCGNHPKSTQLKKRIIRIIEMLKKAENKRLPISAFEKEFGIDKISDSTKFYRPFKLMKNWELIISHRTVEYKNNKRKVKTEYELTPKLFLNHVKRNLYNVCKTELEMI